jgi:hypothetical protein
MSDRHSKTLAYSYEHHIHSARPQTRTIARTAIVEPQPPASLALWSPPYTPPLYAPSPSTHPHPHPPFLLLHPFLQLHASSLPFPAVIVSPHSTSPPPTRDSHARPVPTKTAQIPAHTASADGHKGPQCSVQSSTPKTMTMPPTGPALAGGRRDMHRPSIVSQHSSSVPSTPLQLARRYDTRSRSPSPNGGLGSHSPRSVSSEANSTMPTLRPARPFKCKFETNVGSLGRRRVPYHSSEILEKAVEEPKTALDPHEDDKLSGDMRELYDRLQPNHANTELRNTLVRKAQRILETEFPGNEFKVDIFGSSGNLLWTAESDVDICIQTPMKRLEEMHMLAEALDKRAL